MKVTHVIGSCAPGGAEIFTKSLLIELKKQGLDVDLWVMTPMEMIDPEDQSKLSFQKNFIQELADHKIGTAFIGKRPRKDWGKTRSTLRELYKQGKSDIIHSHLESVSFHVCRAFEGQVPLVQTIHNTKIAHPFVGRFLLKRKFCRYVAISNMVYRVITEYLKIEKEKIRIIHNGVDLTKFQLMKKDYHPPKALIAVGRLTQQKDYPNLLQGFSKLKRRLKAIQLNIPQLRIVGEGELRPQIEQLILEMGLSNYIHLLGVREDIPELLAESDVYVMSSAWEGLSISLIEALAAGMPIVATDAGSNNEIVQNGQSGIIVPCKDAHSLADAIFEVISNRETRERLSINARQRAEKFTIGKCAEKHLEMYEELLKNPKH